MIKRSTFTGFLGALAFLCAAAFVVHAQGEVGRMPTISEAMQLAREGKNGEAIETIRQLIRQSPDGGSSSAHFHLGFLYFKTTQYDAALDAFNAAIARNPESAMSYYFSALIYEAKAVQAGKAQKKEFGNKALAAWQNYLDTSGKAKTRPAGHRGITVEEGVKQAAKHIEMLKEELSHE